MIIITILKDKRLYALLTANFLSSIGSGITMIAIPWLLVNRDGGEQLFGYVSLLMTVILFLISPYLGILIDRFSRKKILLLAEVLALCIVMIFSIWGIFIEEYYTWQLIVLFISGTLYFTFNFPTKFAFNQEIFDRSQYKSLNSIIEIQSQASSMVSGGIASMLIEKIDLAVLLMLNGVTFFLAFLVITFIPYQQKNKSNIRSVTMWNDMKEGYLYLKETPLKILFFTCSFLPFISVMVANYVFPVFVSKTLHADSSILGLSFTVYAIGAVIAGFTIPFLMNRFGTYRTVIFASAIFTLGILVIAWLPVIGIFLLVQIVLGWGNAGTRVARNTIMMDMVPNQIIGRVDSFFQAIGLGIRVAIIGLFTQTIHMTGASISLSIVGTLLILSFIGILLSGKLFEHDSTKSNVKTVGK